MLCKADYPSVFSSPPGARLRKAGRHGPPSPLILVTLVKCLFWYTDWGGHIVSYDSPRLGSVCPSISSLVGLCDNACLHRLWVCLTLLTQIYSLLHLFWEQGTPPIYPSEAGPLFQPRGLDPVPSAHAAPLVTFISTGNSTSCSSKGSSFWSLSFFQWPFSP